VEKKMIVVNVMYLQEDGLAFNMDYYLNTHLPLVGSKWADMGMVSARVVKGLGGGEPYTPPTYHVIATVEFETMDLLQAALGAHGEEIFADIPNFSNVAPVVQVSEVLG
jgi:uncharacterized protein (TIGR02118 family)